jgi:hypothetical protein
MGAAPPAILLELDPVRVVALVLFRRVVAPLALGASQRYQNPHLFLLPLFRTEE